MAIIPTETGHAAPHATGGHREPGFIRKYIFSEDHKIIGIQFLFTALIMLALGGLLAMALRWQLAYPPNPGAGFPVKPVPILSKLFNWDMGIMPPEFYLQMVTMHGSIMIFFAIIPLLVGTFGNYLIPLKIGARDMAFPKLNMISYWLVPPAAVVMLWGFFQKGGAPAAGWTSYAPLSVINPSSQTLWLISLLILGTSSILGAVNYITTIINHRAPGMTYFRMPLAVWALFITAILVLLATPVLASALAMQLLDRLAGTSFFMPGGLVVDKVLQPHSGGQVLMWQHLFWFYSHPAVYIMILPAMGLISEILPVFSRKPIFGYAAMVFSMCAIAGLGFVVWAHHMFQSGMNPLLGTGFMLATILIAVPSAVKTFNWLGTLWGGQIRFTTPMLNALAFVSMFVIGGLSGIFMASAPVDIFIHDTYFIVAHIHYVLFGGSIFGIFAGIYFWFPKMFGRSMNETLGKIHFLLTFITFNFTFFPMHAQGVAGMMRRIADPTQYTGLQHLQPTNIFITMSAFTLFTVQLIFVFNFFWSLFKGRTAGKNPWQSTTLEWTTPSPPPHGNFKEIPTVYHGPYEYSVPGMEDDFLPQDQKPQTPPVAAH